MEKEFLHFDIDITDDQISDVQATCTRRTFLKTSVSSIGITLVPASGIFYSTSANAAEAPPTLSCIKRGCRPVRRADSLVPDVCGRCPHYK